MDTEQPGTGSDASIEDRMFAALTPEAAQAEEQPVTQAETATEVLEDGTEVMEEATSDVVDFVDDDGKAYKIPSALEGKIHLRADYTRKTQEAANLAETAQDRLYFAEVREQFNEVISQKSAELQAMRQQLKQFDSIDMGTLYAQDPASAWRVREQRDELRRQLSEGERHLEQGKAQLGHIAEQHAAKQWDLAVNGAKQRIGTFTPGEDVAMRKQAADLGFTDKELRGRFADPRILHAIYKAAKWDTLQANKGKAVATAQAAPPVLKPGASKGPGAAADQKYRDTRASLAKSGSIQDAARLFLLRG